MKSKMIMLWDSEKRHSVRADKIREISLYPPAGGYNRQRWPVYGWYNNEDRFFFGGFDTEDEARAFIESLHKQMKEG